MNDKTIKHSVVAAHELSEHACVVVLGSESQGELILGLNGLQAVLSMLAPDNKDLISPLLRRNLTGAVAVLVERLRDIACGVGGYDRFRLEPDSASELLELAEKLGESS